MHESSLGESLLGIVVYGEGALMGEFILDFDGHDLVSESLRTVIPLPMFLHESIEALAFSRAPGEDQNVAFGLFPLRLTCLVKGFDHNCIVASAGVPWL